MLIPPYIHITDPLSLEGPIQEINKTLKMIQDRLEKQEILPQKLLDKVEDSKPKVSDRPLEESHSIDVQNHLLQDFLDPSYSPPPLPPPLQHSSLPSIALPTSTTTPSQLSEPSTTPVQSQTSRQSHVSLSVPSQGNITPFSSTCDISQSCTTQQGESVQCLPIVAKPSTATLPADAIDKKEACFSCADTEPLPKTSHRGKSKRVGCKISQGVVFW